jgi:hypothetical protein
MKGKVFYHPIEGSASLTISWSSAPKGDAIEAKQGNGVGFFSTKGNLLCVIFDEVESTQDHQVLAFKNHRITITVKNSKVTYRLTQSKPISQKRKKLATKKKRYKTPNRKKTKIN